MLLVKWMALTGVVLSAPTLLQVSFGGVPGDDWAAKITTIAGAFLMIVSAISAIPSLIIKVRKARGKGKDEEVDRLRGELREYKEKYDRLKGEKSGGL